MATARPAILRALALVLLFCCGAAVLCALQHGFYATALVAGLAAGSLAVAETDGVPERPPRPTAAPSTEDAEMRQLRLTLDQVPAPLLALDPGGSLRALNRAARTLFAADDLIADPPAGTLGAITRAAAGERVILRPEQPGGRAMAIAVATSFGPQGARLLAVLTDVEAELQLAEAAALRDLLAVLSHEIMNALTPVSSLAESAQAALHDGTAQGLAQADEALGIILRRAGELDRFVRGYRALARLPTPQLQATSAASLLRDAAALFAAGWGQAGVALILQPPRPDVIASLDAGLIGQALLNLLANAAESALDGQGPPSVWLSAEADGGSIMFRVRDNGPGVPAERAAAIFAPFNTGKKGGHGIGLSLARQIAQSHGGRLELESGGVGACFVLTV